MWDVSRKDGEKSRKRWITDEKQDEEDDVDDKFSQSRLDLDVALVAVFCYSRSPQRCKQSDIVMSI